MKPLMRIFLALLYLSLTVGCATVGQSTFSYTPPDKKNTVKNRLVIKQNFDDSWNNLLRGITTNFFDIKLAEKSSRVISVAIPRTKTENYIDCGLTIRTFEFMREKTQYTFPFSSDASFKKAGHSHISALQPAVFHTNTKGILEGVINFFVTPLGPSSTEILVNVQYTLYKKYIGYQVDYALSGQVIPKQYPFSYNADPITFTSTQAGSATVEGKKIECIATGTLETQLINLIKR